MEMESVFLDNLPDTANMILNILWDRNEEMCTADPDGLCGEEKAWISCILHCIRFRL